MILLLVYLGIGALAGIFAGLLGVGGGLVVVPLLSTTFYYIGFPSGSLMHFAIGSSLASMVTTTFFSTWAHYRNGVVVTSVLKLMAGGIVVGSILGGIVAGFFQSKVLSISVGIFALLISLQIFFNVEWKSRAERPSDQITRAFSLIIGTLSSLLGIGAGSMGVPFLISYRKLSIYQAVGICAALSFIVSLAGTLTYYFTGTYLDGDPEWSSGYIYWPAVLGINLSSPFFSWGAAQMAHLLPIQALKKIFATFLFVVGIRMLIF